MGLGETTTTEGKGQAWGTVQQSPEPTQLEDEAGVSGGSGLRDRDLGDVLETDRMRFVSCCVGAEGEAAYEP